MVERGSELLNSIWSQIRDMHAQGLRPNEVRIGVEDWRDIVMITNPYTGPLSITPDAQTLFGVPLKRLPIRHAVSIV